MVRLDRIYTGGGDKGETSLGDGSRVPKHGKWVAAIGDVDEANSAIGLARVAVENGAMLARIQNDLFDLGADLARPIDKTDSETDDARLRIAESQVVRLEGEIDGINRDLAPLNSFVLPGGSEAASRLHVARAVVRRAERTVAALAAAEQVNPQVLAYLNRLSDLLFVMARKANANGDDDILWQPGKTRE
jgi:cob(I)alamin adenosyltransferase